MNAPNFSFKNINIRAVEIEGEPWFVAADVRRALSIQQSGLYKLIIRSDKPQSREFQDWVTKVVLPAIRKDGGYIMGEERGSTGLLSEDELVYQAMPR